MTEAQFTIDRWRDDYNAASACSLVHRSPTEIASTWNEESTVLMRPVRPRPVSGIHPSKGALRTADLDADHPSIHSRGATNQ